MDRSSRSSCHGARHAGAVRIGVCIIPTDPWPVAVAQARRVESLGYDHLWTYDHLSWRHYRERPWFAAIPWLAGLAGVTSTVGLGTLVCSPNFREPLTLAKDAIVARPRLGRTLPPRRRRRRDGLGRDRLRHRATGPRRPPQSLRRDGRGARRPPDPPRLLVRRRALRHRRRPDAPRSAPGAPAPAGCGGRRPEGARARRPLRRRLDHDR